jgi:hypothetical protein
MTIDLHDLDLDYLTPGGDERYVEDTELAIIDQYRQRDIKRFEQLELNKQRFLAGLIPVTMGSNPKYYL